MTGEQVNLEDKHVEAIVWSSNRRFWVSLLLLFHLFCVVLAPLAVVDPRAGLAVDAQRILRPYSESMYLIHGYRFFAPEPGPGHSIHFEITTNTGEKIAGHFPDRDHHWPRLRYHRWFMLSESVFGQLSETLDAKELAEWQKQIVEQIKSLIETDPRAAESLERQMNREIADNVRMVQMRDRLVTGIGKTLLRHYDGQLVDLKLVTRLIPPPQDIEVGLTLDNPRYTPAELTYQLGTVYANRDELESIVPQEEAGRSDEDGEGRAVDKK